LVDFVVDFVESFLSSVEYAVVLEAPGLEQTTEDVVETCIG
jgi:hypothetical protein